MKRLLLVPALTVAAMLFAARANGGTLHVFAEYLGTASYASPSQAQQDAYASFLSNSDMDFGVFYGPSSAGNFGFSHSSYSKSSGSEAGGAGGYHIFVYKTARWRLLKRYDMVTASNKKNSADACVVEDTTTGEQFIFLMPSGNTFPYVNSGSAIAPVTSMKSTCQSEYPNAKMIVGVSLAYGLFDGSKLGESIVAWGCTQARSGTSGGAIYAQDHESRSGLSAGSVSWLTGAAEPAATATVTYDAGSSPDMFSVRFLHEDGTVISEQQVEYQGAATAPANPAPLSEDRVFYKWSCSYSSIVADTDVVAVFVNKVVEISTGAQFAEYMASSLANNTAITFAFTTDISLSAVTYTKPATFAATLDGRGHALRNFPSDRNIKSLCGTLKGTIRNLCIANYSAPTSVGGTSLIASSAQGATVSGVVMTNCSWTVPSASQGTAGFFYETKSSLTTITNCTMINCKVLGNGATKGDQAVGGFVSKAASLTMVDCHFIMENPNTVAIGNTIPVAGALIGQCASGVTIKRCSNNGRVKVASYVAAQAGGAGGLVGKSISNSGSPTIVNCANFGIVESTENYPAGGVIGEFGATNANFAVTVKSCFNYGNVSSPLAAGGIIGSYRGASSTIVNCGNAGDVSSPAGFAGGLVGRFRYYGNNGTTGFENAFQCGAVTTESGFAGLLAGGLTDSTGSGLTLAVNNCFMAGSATASAGGKAGLAIGGCDSASTGALALSVSGGGVLDSNASLQPGYNAAGQALQWTAPSSFAPTALVNRMVLSPLDAAAEAGGWMRWIQGRDHPELALFGEMYTYGIAVVFF